MADPEISVTEDQLAPFFRQLARFGLAGASEKAALVTAAALHKDFAKGACLGREGERADVLWIVTKGIALGTRSLTQGEQQHLALFVPGDVVDLEGFALNRNSMTSTSLSLLGAVGINRSALMNLISRRPEVALTVMRLMAAQMLVAQEWLRGMGRRSARARTAHFLCELHTRLADAGLAGHDDPFPLTQAELSDVLGLSVVHINRVLQQLRADGLIGSRQGRMEIIDWPRLRRAGDFDEAYLHAVVEGR